MAPRTAAVTGASGGIGRAVVGRLVTLGFQVHAIALADQALTSMEGLDSITAHGMDVRDTDALTALLGDLDVDVLVNNAGVIGDLQPAQTMTAVTADALIDINLGAAVHGTLAVLPAMVARGDGHIIFTGSIAASRPTANSAVYSATKAALHAFADGLRMDLHGTAIRITVLAPGRVETSLYDDALGGHDQAVERLYAGATAIQPADIAAIVGMAVTLPRRVDVTRIEVVPTMQVFGGSSVADAQRTEL